MKLDEFNALTDEEKATFLSSIESTQKSIEDLTAERDSFKSENDDIKAQLENSNKELKATKEMNFTLARKISTAESPKDDEQILYEFMKGIKENGN